MIQGKCQIICNGSESEGLEGLNPRILGIPQVQKSGNRDSFSHGQRIVEQIAIKIISQKFD